MQEITTKMYEIHWEARLSATHIIMHRINSVLKYQHLLIVLGIWVWLKLQIV